MNPFPPGAPSAPSPVLALRHGRLAWLIFGVSTGLGILLSGQAVLATRSFGWPMPWPMAIASGLTEMWLWGLAVPLIFALARRFPFSRPTWWTALGVHLVCAVALICAYGALRTVIVERALPTSLRPSTFFRPPPPPPPPGAVGQEPLRKPLGQPTLTEGIKLFVMPRLYLLVLTYGLLVGIAHGLAQMQRLRARESQARELSRQLAEARLQALRMQLNPHFLFNTLNAISTLVHRDPHAADEMIACLSDFLRLTLAGSAQPESNLGTELEFARRYLDIEKVRFGDHLVIEEAIPSSCLPALVPTLILQPLLENAVRHGIEPEERRGTIHLAAERLGSILRLRIADTGSARTHTQTGGSRSAALDGAAGRGVGLANTRARLKELYGERATLELRHPENGGTAVEIQIPWHEAPLPESFASITALVGSPSAAAPAPVSVSVSTPADATARSASATPPPPVYPRA